MHSAASYNIYARQPRRAILNVEWGWNILVEGEQGEQFLGGKGGSQTST